jgi:hypothetical protein
LAITLSAQALIASRLPTGENGVAELVDMRDHIPRHPDSGERRRPVDAGEHVSPIMVAESSSSTIVSCKWRNLSAATIGTRKQSEQCSKR